LIATQRLRLLPQGERKFNLIGSNVGLRHENRMDKLLEKYLNEELTEEEFNGELGKLTDDQKKEFDQHLAKPEVQAQLSAKAKEVLEKVTGLRREQRRLKDNPPPAEKPKDYSAQMREENVETASNQFFAEHNIPQEQRQHYLDAFKSNDSGSVGVEKIKKDFERIYASENSTELLGIQKRFKEMEQGAEDFNSHGAGSHGGAGGGGGNDDDKKYSPAVHDYVREAKKQGINLTLEGAKRVLERGLTRTF